MRTEIEAAAAAVAPVPAATPTSTFELPLKQSGVACICFSLTLFQGWPPPPYAFFFFFFLAKWAFHLLASIIIVFDLDRFVFRLCLSIFLPVVFSQLQSRATRTMPISAVLGCEAGWWGDKKNLCLQIYIGNNSVVFFVRCTACVFSYTHTGAKTTGQDKTDRLYFFFLSFFFI